MKIFTSVFIILVITSTITMAQTKVGEIAGNFEVVKQSFNVVDESTGNFALFVEDRDYIYGKLYNSNYEVLGWINSPDLSSKFKSIIGYKVEGNTYTLFMSTLNERSYGIVSFDFEKRVGSSKELDFKLHGEKLLDVINHNNSIYMMTVPDRSSQINFYDFQNFENPILKEIKFEENNFLDRRERLIDFSSITNDSGVSQLSIDHPNSLEIASRELKLYKQGNKIVITSDKYIEFTYVVEINLDTFQKSVQRIEKPVIDDFKMGLKTNSFYKDNRLFQLIANSDILKFQVVNLDSEEIIKNFTLMDDEPLFFKNTPIVLEGGEFNAYRELETTNQFLRKISSGDIGISVFKHNDLYQITFGSTAEKQNMGAIIVGGLIGGAVGSLLLSSINQLTTSYALYKNTKSIKITGLFNENFNHIKGNVEKNDFDVITEKLQEIKRVTAETLFYVKGNYIYAYYDKNEGLYKIFQL